MIKQHLINLFKTFQYNLAILFPKQVKANDFKKYEIWNTDHPDLSTFPEPELFFIHYLVPPDSTIIDIGSNVGIYIYRYKQTLQSCRIIGFEPIPLLYKRLKRLFPEVEIFDFAISDKTEERSFKIPYIDGQRYDTRGTLHQYTEEKETNSAKISVKTISLDEFVIQNKIENISFIKIDIEGHEIAALNGAEKTLKKFKPLLLIEIEQRHHKEISIQRIFDRITNVGYQGFFFDTACKKFRPLSAFDLSLHQNVQHMDSYYINNFLFVKDADSYVMSKFQPIEELLESRKKMV